MKNQKVYESTDKLINVISDNYSVLQSLGAFGINLGFGDKTVEEVCNDEKVDTYTFLAVVNYTVNGYNVLKMPQISQCLPLFIILRQVTTISLAISCLPLEKSLRRLLTKKTIWQN